MAEQEPPVPTDGRIEFYKETAWDRIARWTFWIVFGGVTIAALIWLRFDGA
jgi:hypothetical protein